MALMSFILIMAALLAPQPASQQPASPAQSSASLDYATFKDRVQPILTSPRKGNARCTACHSHGGGNSYLEELSPGSATYNEEQSRRNFQRVLRLVVPGEPLKSPLLMNPLAEEAGGSHWHGGGKHWRSQQDPEWVTLAARVSTTSAAPVPLPAPTGSSAAASTSAPASSSSLNFDVFKTRVQPILTSPRQGNARCIACHSRGGGNSYMEPLAPGSTTYTEEQSRRNFERIQRLVLPGVPTKSPLLMNPLAEEAGGSHWHGGGKHWRSQQDPEWVTLAARVSTTSAAPVPLPAPTGSSAAASTSAPASSSSLNFDVFKTRVQPILTSPRKGNARCIACHSRGGGNSYLEPLAPGSTTYTEEQSRRNFERIQRLVLPG